MDEENKALALPEYEVSVSADKMLAYIRLTNSLDEIAAVERDDVLAELKKQGIRFGISDEDIDRFCLEKSNFRKHKVAFGLRSVDGEDGKFHLLFDTSKPGPRILPDGRADYKDLNLIRNVEKGDLLCTIVLPVEGEDGKNVYGEKVSAKIAKPAGVRAGTNTSLSEDGTEIRADVDGCVTYQDQRISVQASYKIYGDVGTRTGHVIFNGAVHVEGNVLEGFNVIATKDIYVSGRVENSGLKAKGNIVIGGANRAKIQAGGDVTAKFLENSEVTCGGDLHCDMALMTEIKAEGAVLMRGNRASIIGGSTLAGGKIVAKTLGSERNLQQVVSVLRNWKKIEEKSVEAGKDNPRALELKLDSAKRYYQMYMDKIKEQNELGEEKDMETLRELLHKKSEIAETVSSLTDMISHLKQDEEGACVVCLGTIFPGVRLSIDNCRMMIRQQWDYQKFYVNQGEIVTGAILPGDADA